MSLTKDGHRRNEQNKGIHGLKQKSRQERNASANQNGGGILLVEIGLSSTSVSSFQTFFAPNMKEEQIKKKVNHL